jgi:histidyl-tRNA synthetase
MKKITDAEFALIVGEEELKQGVVKVKDMKTGEQTTVPRESIEAYCKNKNM